MNYVDVIKSIRIDRELSLREFARIIKLSAPYISDLEHGNRVISLEVINHITNNIQLTNEEILNLTISYNNAHPTLGISKEVINYIIKNNLNKSLLQLINIDEDGTKIKKLLNEKRIKI